MYRIRVAIADITVEADTRQDMRTACSKLTRALEDLGAHASIQVEYLAKVRDADGGDLGTVWQPVARESVTIPDKDSSE